MPASFTALAGWRDLFHEILIHLEPPTWINDDEPDDDEDEAEAYYPSLNKLWSSLNTLGPLLDLLPSVQRDNSDILFCDIYIYRLTGKISSEAWSRFQTYASRVRHVFVSQDFWILPRVWTAISERCEGAALFPNLVTLRITIWNSTDISSIRVLATPSLRNVILVFEQVPGTQDIPAVITLATGLMLQELSVKSPGLKCFTASGDVGPDNKHLIDLPQFTKLEVLDINDHSPLDNDLLPVLADFRNLTRLEVSILLRESAEAAPLNLKGGFQKLTRLTLRGLPAHLMHFILASSMPQLNHLCLAVRSHVGDGFDTCLASICRHIGPHTLTRFCAELWEFRHPPRLLFAFLQPLLPFAHLEELEISLQRHIPVRDEDLERFARAWPKLRTFLLTQSAAGRIPFNPDTVPGAVERPTLHGLVELARGFPRLNCLCIPDLDATVLPSVKSVPLMGHGLLNLCIENLVGAQDEERQLDVAVVIDRLFPRLKLKCGGIEQLPAFPIFRSVDPVDSRNVSRLLRAMQIARKHYPGGI